MPFCKILDVRIDLELLIADFCFQCGEFLLCSFIQNQADLKMLIFFPGFGEWCLALSHALVYSWLLHELSDNLFVHKSSKEYNDLLP